MSAGHRHHTLVLGDARSDWTCGRGAMRGFFGTMSAHAEARSDALHNLANRPLVIVTDENVERLYGQEFPPGIPRIVIQPGEAAKTFHTLADVLQSMLGAGLDRGGAVIAFGGGVVGDLAGFAAATFMRGVAWVSVPTTLLAMVDASIGGKTGVDVNGAKNLAGAFHPPVAVVADPLVLTTLPACERAAGMAEVIKEAVIGDRALFERLEGGLFDDAEDVATAAEVKIEVVERDPFERGERAVLNLGHTIGHGIESASGYELSHGYAVAVGLVAEARIAERIGLAQTGLASRIAAVVSRFSLPTTSNVAVERARAAMSSDKKRRGARLTFAMPRDVGDVVYGIEVEERLLREVLGEVCRR